MQDIFIASIQEMRMVDQELRKGRSGPEITQAHYLVYAVDQAHNWRIHRLIDEFGYPTKESIGAEVLKDFWLIVQHQDGDVTLQQNCFDKCGFEKVEKAYLLDRIRSNKKEKQEFGTQMQRNPQGVFEPKPIRDSGNVDKRRKETGLEPLAEYIEKANKS